MVIYHALIFFLRVVHPFLMLLRQIDRKQKIT